jgi:cytochrome b6-f complex iron-sulfur subunit
MADETKPDTQASKPAPQAGEPAAAGVGSGQSAGAPPTGANRAATPHSVAPGAARPAPAARPPAAPTPDLAGKTTSAASPGGAAARTAAPAAAATATAVPARAAASTRDPDDASPLLTRRAWMGLAWGAFSAASVAALAATGRFMFPNVLTEPPQQFVAGFPNEYGMGVDERWKEKFGVWIVRTPDDIVARASGFYALLVTCTHLGCTPNYLAAEAKFKCPCHGSGFRVTGINFEGPAPRPLERARIVLAPDGQLLVDKARKFQFELGQWTDPDAFLRI